MSSSLKPIESAHTPSNAPTKAWSAAELRTLGTDHRNTVLEAAAILAESDYRNDAELTAFDAFGKYDLYWRYLRWGTGVAKLTRRHSLRALSRECS